MEPQPEAQQLTIRDVGTHEPSILQNIGSRISLHDRNRLGEALGRYFRDFRLGARRELQVARTNAVSRIQSFMRAPVIQNTIERTGSPLDISYSVRPTGRTDQQIRVMRRRINEFNEPEGRGIAQLRTRGGARIDRGR